MNDIHPKVAAATGGSTAGALVVIVVWVLSLYNVAVPDAVSTALTILVGTAGAFVAGYLTPAPKTATAPEQSK